MGKPTDIFCGDRYSPVVDSETGEVCCKNCGFVAGRDDGDAFRGKEKSFGDDYERRHDAPFDATTLSGTYIGNKGVDSVGKNIPFAMKKHIESLYKVENMDKTRRRNRSVVSAEGRLHKIGSVLKMTEAHMREALDVYKAAWERGIVKRRSFDSSVAASLMCVLRKYEVPISFQEVAEVSNITRKRIMKAYTAIRKNMSNVSVSELPNMSSYVSKIVAASRLPEVKKEAYRREITENLQYLRDGGYLGGAKPAGAAGAVAYATQLRNREWKGAITQKAIYEVVDTTMPTVRRWTKALKTPLNQLYAERADSGKKDKPPSRN